MSSIRKSLVISLTERYLLIGLQLVSFLTLARLLTPEDIGLYSVAAAFIGLAHVIRDFGIGSYLIQEEDLTLARKRTAFTITLIIGISFFFILRILSYPIADFYEEQRMVGILQLLAVNFLLIPLNSVTLATLRRELQFNVLFWINIAAAFVGTMTAIGLASTGYGYMSLVWASIANTATTCAGGLLHHRAEFWLLPTLVEWRRITNFGSKITATSITNEIASSSNDIFAGRFLGFEAVGLISRAMGIMNLFHRDITAAIRGVALPAFSQAKRAGADLEQHYVSSVIALSGIAFPFYGFFALFPQESLRLLFGTQWDAAAPLIIWFCAAGAVGATASLIPTLLMARGEASLLFRLHIVIDPLRITCFFFALYTFRTSQAYAIVFLLFFVLSVPYMYYLKEKVQPTQYQVLLPGILKSIYASAATLGITYFLSLLLRHFVGEFNPVWLAPLGIVTLLTWLVIVILIRHPLCNDTFFKSVMARLGIHYVY